MVKFLHTSDWQIGMKGGGLGSAGDLVRKARIESIKNVFSTAKENSVDFVLISGDVFEHNMVGSEEVSSVISIFNQFQDIPIYLLPGNHDYLGPGSVYKRDIFSRVEHLTILDSRNPIELDRVTIHPDPVFSIFTGRGEGDRFRCVIDEPGVHIGVAHGSLIGGFGVTDDIDLPIDPSCVEKSGLDYLALGHWHSHHVFNDSHGVPRIAYSGTHEQTKYEENEAGYCLLVEIKGKGAAPTITPVKCGGLSWNSIEFTVRDRSSLNELEELLDSYREVDMLRLELMGELDLQYQSDLVRILDYHNTLHQDFRIIQDSMQYTVPVNVDSIRDFGDPTLNKVDAELRKRLSIESAPISCATLIEALSLLHRLSEEEHL